MAMYYTPIPHEFLEEMGELSDAEYGRLIRWCQTYSITGEEIELSGNERFFRVRCKSQIDKAKEAYEESARKKSEAGKRGMEKRWHSQNITDDNTAITGDNTPITEIANKNKNKNKKENGVLISDDINTMSDPQGGSDAKTVVSAWNEMAKISGVPPVSKILSGSTRDKQLKKRIHDYGLDSILTAIRNVSESDFLTGRGSKGWMISFDWFIKPNNFAKVLDGNYANRASADSVKGKTAQVAEWTRELEEKYETG